MGDFFGGDIVRLAISPCVFLLYKAERTSFWLLPLVDRQKRDMDLLISLQESQLFQNVELCFL